MSGNIQKNLKAALEELFASANVEENGLLVAGCSTSEVVGEKIGTAGSGEAAQAIFDTLASFCRGKKNLPGGSVLRAPEPRAGSRKKTDETERAYPGKRRPAETCGRGIRDGGL